MLLVYGREREGLKNGGKIGVVGAGEKELKMAEISGKEEGQETVGLCPLSVGKQPIPKNRSLWRSSWR